LYFYVAFVPHELVSLVSQLYGKTSYLTLYGLSFPLKGIFTL